MPGVAERTWSWAVWRSTSRAARPWPGSVLQLVLVSARPRRWGPLHPRRSVRPRRRVARRASFPGAATVLLSPGRRGSARRDDRGGAPAGASIMGRIGASPTALPVTSTARAPSVASSTARCTSRRTRPRAPPCVRACRSPSPRTSTPVPSTSGRSGPPPPRQGGCTASDFRRRHGAPKPGTGRPVPAGSSSLAPKPVVCRSGRPGAAWPPGKTGPRSSATPGSPRPARSAGARARPAAPHAGPCPGPGPGRPDARRAAPTRRRAVGGPIQGAMTGRRGLGRLARPCRRTRDVNYRLDSWNEALGDAFARRASPRRIEPTSAGPSTRGTGEPASSAPSSAPRAFEKRGVDQ